MRRTLAMIAVVLSALPAAAVDLGGGMPASGVEMLGVDGGHHSIEQVAGPKGTLVVFTCNACPWAKAWEERIAALGNEYQAKGIGVIAINSNDPAKVAEDSYEVMQERAKQRGFTFPYVVDGTSDVARAYGATRTPEAFLFDAAGKLVYHGTIDDNAQDPSKVVQHYLGDALAAVVAGGKVPEPETKALGCTIKFRSGP